MPNICGKIVNSLGKHSRKTSEFLSTVVHILSTAAATNRVKPPLLHTFFPGFTHAPSTPIYSYLPLTEHYFYPVSTAPITTIIKEKIKER